jgi:hypothetical protein
MNVENQLGKIVEAFDQKVGPDQASGGLKLSVFEREADFTAHQEMFCGRCTG